jgi:hypothetical protein
MVEDEDYRRRAIIAVATIVLPASLVVCADLLSNFYETS